MQKGANFIVRIFALLLAHASVAAQPLVSSPYIGHAPGAARGRCGDSIWLDTDGERIWSARYGGAEASSDGLVLRDTGTVWVRFSPYAFFRGKASRDGLSIKGRLVLFSLDQDHFIVRPYRLRAAQVPGHITLSGIALSLTDSNGMGTYRVDPQGVVSFGMTWNTREDFFNNIYVFTNQGNRRVFLNAGNDEASLNLNTPLAPGTHTFQFAGAPRASEGFFTLTLYFDNDPARRISGFLDLEGATELRPVPSDVETFDQYFSTQPSSGSLSLATSNFSVTLTEFRFARASDDLVGGACSKPDGGPDTTGRFTLRITRHE